MNTNKKAPASLGLTSAIQFLNNVKYKINEFFKRCLISYDFIIFRFFYKDTKYKLTLSYSAEKLNSISTFEIYLLPNIRLGKLKFDGYDFLRGKNAVNHWYYIELVLFNIVDIGIVLNTTQFNNESPYRS